MLVLSRKPQERVFVLLESGRWMAVTLVRSKGGKSGGQLGFQMPVGLLAYREECLTEEQRDQAIEDIRGYERGRS